MTRSAFVHEPVQYSCRLIHAQPVHKTVHNLILVFVHKPVQYPCSQVHAQPVQCVQLHTIVHNNN